MPRIDYQKPVHLQQVAVFVTLVIGAVVTMLWITNVGLLAVESEISPLLFKVAFPTLALTLLALIWRFLRWHYLLRVCRIKIPIRESLVIFLSGLLMIITPLYLGEITKAFLLKNRYSAKLTETIALVIFERLWDVVAVLFLFCLATPLSTQYLTLISLASIVGGGTLLLGARFFKTVIPGQLLQPRVLIICFSTSFISWLCTSTTLFTVTLGTEVNLNFRHMLQLYSVSTLLGALSLMPAGLGVTGSTLIFQLQTLGLPPQKAVAVVIVLRSLTVWASISLGLFALFYGARHWGWFKTVSVINHFNDIAESYEDTIPLHIRKRLLDRKLAPIIHQLRQIDHRTLMGLDLGSGQGWYLQHLQREGFQVVGVDSAWEQLATAAKGIRENHVTPCMAVSNAIALPFASDSFDFIYCINVMHHIENRSDQRKAFKEIARLLKPQGYFFLHEINVTNPVFRIYMGYIFPLIKIIDTGVEEWLLPHDISGVPNLYLRETHYFTFLPDFTPKFLYKFLLGFEAWLEQSAWRNYSAHYLSIFNKAATN